MTDEVRYFPKSITNEKWIEQNGKCLGCGKQLVKDHQSPDPHMTWRGGWQAHHIIPYEKDGATSLKNCALLCNKCHLDIHPLSKYEPHDKRTLKINEIRKRNGLPLRKGCLGEKIPGGRK